MVDFTKFGKITEVVCYPSHGLVVFLQDEIGKISYIDESKKIRELDYPIDQCLEHKVKLSKDRNDQYLLGHLTINTILVWKIDKYSKPLFECGLDFECEGSIVAFNLYKFQGAPYIMAASDSGELRSLKVVSEELLTEGSAFNIHLEAYEVLSGNFSVNQNYQYFCICSLNIENGQTSNIYMLKIDDRNSLSLIGRVVYGAEWLNKLSPVSQISLALFTEYLPIVLLFEGSGTNSLVVLRLETINFEVYRRIKHYHEGEVQRVVTWNDGIWSLDVSGNLKFLMIK